MRVKPFFILIFLCVGIVIFFKLDHDLRDGVLSVGDRVKGSIFDLKEWGKMTYEQYFNQASNIQKLHQQLQEFERIKLQNLELQGELQRLIQFYHMPPLGISDIFPVRAISYYEFGNYERIWIEGYEDGEEGEIYGLIVGGFVVGIAKMGDDGRVMGYLNGDPLCSYGVYIGQNKAPGIFRSVEGEIEIDYIPLGSEIKEGDEVITNGLDEIFFENIAVGKISKVFESNGYLKAKVTLYAPKVNLGYMWLLDRSKNAKATF